MEEYLNKEIKDVINLFPGVEDILDEYGIGCGACSVGTCLLKDIVSIHQLPADQEAAMMTRIAEVIHSGKGKRTPKTRRKTGAGPGAIKYSPPMKKLVEEHVLIKRWVALIPKVLKNLDLESEEGKRLILDGVDFIRSYADRYHHEKEEDILFKYFDEALDILKVMHQDHTAARAHVKAILEAVERKDRASVAEHLTAYGAILTEHITKEDEILYPWMDRNLSTRQIGEIFSKFNEAENRLGYSPAKYERFIEGLEQKDQP